MSLATPTLETVNERLDDLTNTVKKLEKEVAQLKKTENLSNPRPTATPTGQEELVRRLIAKGFLMEPSAETLAWVEQLKAEHEAMPEEEKREIEEELKNLHLDPPLSEIIIRLRRGWEPDEPEFLEE